MSTVVEPVAVSLKITSSAARKSVGVPAPSRVQFWSAAVTQRLFWEPVQTSDSPVIASVRNPFAGPVLPSVACFRVPSPGTVPSVKSDTAPLQAP